MKAVSGKRMAKLTESKGWCLARVNGSHHINIKENLMLVSYSGEVRP